MRRRSGDARWRSWITRRRPGADTTPVTTGGSGMARETAGPHEPWLPPGDQEPTEPEPGSYSGGFSGQTVITVAPRAGAGAVAATIVDTFDLREQLATAWNSARPTFRNELAQRLVTESGGRLYDIHVAVPAASAADSLDLFVIPSRSTVGLSYLIPGHQASGQAKAPGLLKNPSFTVNFTVRVNVTVHTDGAPRQPMSLQRAEAYLGNAQARLDAHLITRVAAWLKDLFGGTSAEQALELGFNARTGDLTAAVQPLVVTAGNIRLAALMDTHSRNRVVPRYDRDHHQLELQLELQKPSEQDTAER